MHGVGMFGSADVEIHGKSCVVEKSRSLGTLQTAEMDEGAKAKIRVSLGIKCKRDISIGQENP